MQGQYKEARALREYLGRLRQAAGWVWEVTLLDPPRPIGLLRSLLRWTGGSVSEGCMVGPSPQLLPGPGTPGASLARRWEILHTAVP